MSAIRRSRRPGFTLIELLIVISILSLLAALLIPALARSRENARSVVCRTRLAEMAKAMLMYTTDSRGVLPYEDRPNLMDPVEKHRVCWYDSLNRYLKTTDKNPGVKVCPTVQRDDPNSPESFRMNSKLSETNSLSKYFRPYRHADQLKRPMQTVLLFDGDVGGEVVSFKGRWRISNDDVNYRHNARTNILFVAGNIENIHKDVLFERSRPNAPVVWQPPDLGPWNPNPIDE